MRFPVETVLLLMLNTCDTQEICDIPQFVNAIYKGDKTFLRPNERLEYECMDGYETESGQTIGFKICDHDEWPTVLECYERTCNLPILHQVEPDLKKEKYKVGDVLTFRCIRRFKIVGPSSVQCYHFGWSPRLPICKKEVNCCEQPPEILNGIAKDSKKMIYCHDDVVEYNCNLGFVRRGPRKIQCNDGEWTTLPTCIEEKRRCAEVPELSHGYIQTTTDLSYSHGSSVEYGCVENFIMVGKKTSTCIHGNWTQLPTCFEKYRLGKCELKFFEDLQVNILNAFHFIIINYKCNWNSKFKITTCRNGRWYPPPNCPTMKSCTPPPQIPNSQDINIMVNYKDGEKIGIICKENYILQGQEEIICENGHWNSLPRCIEKQPCSKPPAIKYGALKSVKTSEDNDNLEPNIYGHDTIVSYMCQQGFMMIGGEEIKCHMGKWSSPPRCVDARCLPPPKFNNADIVGTFKTYYMPGDSVIYQCSSNFHPEGSIEVTCTGGNWKGDPQCKEELKTCGPPPPIGNGDITTFPLHKYAPETRVEYRCQNLYVLQGSKFVICKNGIWTNAPTCLDSKR